MKTAIAFKGNGLASLRIFVYALALACALFDAWMPAVAATNRSIQMPRSAPRQAIAVNAESESTLSESKATWHGESHAALTERWWQWLESIPYGVGPNGDPSGANCGVNQEGPVWFLAAPVGGTFSSACTIPAGKIILSAVFAVIDDYPCPPPQVGPPFGPPPGQSLDAFLKADITQFVDAVAYATATLDNEALHVRRVKTSLFPFTAAASNLQGDSCITGSPQLGVSDGYFVFIEPLPPGQHVLRLQSAATGGPVTDVTTTLTVQ